MEAFKIFIEKIGKPNNYMNFEEDDEKRRRVEKDAELIDEKKGKGEVMQK
jgi:hypothetical protein